MRRITFIVLLALAVSVPAVAQEAEPGRRILGTEHLRVLHWPEHRELAKIARDSGESAIVRLEALLDTQLDRRIDVYIVRSRAELDELTGTENQPWIIGRAISAIRRVVVKPMGPQRLPGLIAHELAHIMLDLRMGEDAHLLPRWLHEGIAKYAAGDFSEADRRLIAEAALGDRLLTIEELEEAFRGNRDQVSLAYAQSYTLVQYLSDIQPARGISPLLDQLARERDMRLALGLAFHRPVPQIESEWLETLRMGYVHHIAPPLSEAIIGALFVIAFAIAWVLVRRRSARIRKRMRHQEELREAAAAGFGPEAYTVLPVSEPESDDSDEPPMIE
ncbi:MAG: peptidase MA family metallohydrolase [Armatimonadota bacterium]|jgi:hypothetical protein